MPYEGPLYSLSDARLSELERDYPTGVHPMYGPNLGAEINRRRALKAQRNSLIGIGIAAASAFFSMCAAIASWYTVYLKLG
jgi:hypothetical protein